MGRLARFFALIRGKRGKTALRELQDVMRATGEDRVQASESIIATVADDRIGVKSIRHTGAEGRVVAADIDASGSARALLGGPVPQGEDDTQAVCVTLIQRLNGDENTDWGMPREPLTEMGVDRIAEGSRGILHISVTRVVLADLYKTAAQKGVIEEATDVQAVADAMRVAIERKLRKPRNGITLALNARSIPLCSFPLAVQTFMRRHAGWTESLGYDAVYVVGLGANSVTRLA